MKTLSIICTIVVLGLGNLIASQGQGVLDTLPPQSIVPPMMSMPPPPPPPVPEKNREIFKVVEEMPRFPGCETKVTYEEKISCTEEKVSEYIANNISYPIAARDLGIECKVVVGFIVDKEGNIIDEKIYKDVGHGCGEAALSVIKGMNKLKPKWVPGKQRNKNVEVLLTREIKFK